MLHAGVCILFDYVKAVLSAAIVELERDREKFGNPGSKDDLEQIMVK